MKSIIHIMYINFKKKKYNKGNYLLIKKKINIIRINLKNNNNNF